MLYLTHFPFTVKGKKTQQSNKTSPRLKQPFTFRYSFQIVTAEGEAQGFVRFAMELVLINGDISLPTICKLHVQHLQGAREKQDFIKIIYFLYN